MIMDTLVDESIRADAQAEAMAASGDISPDSLPHLRDVAFHAVLLMEEHGLRPGEPGGWSFKWDRAWQRAGLCDYRRKVLSFSPKLFAVWESFECENTVLHEIAHALVNDGRSHSRAWQLKHIELGGDGRVTYDSNTVETVAVPQRQARKYEGRCPHGHTTQRVRLPKNRVSCGKCSSRFDERFLLTWYRL